MKKNQKDPIVLTGRAYVDKLLAAELTHLALPHRVEKGDIKVIALIHGDRSKSPRAPRHKFAGFFSAYVFDGKQWRKFAIRCAAAVEATYGSDGERRSKAQSCIKNLKGLKGATAIWGEHAYEVHNPVTFAGSQAEANATVPATVTVPAAKPGKPVQLLLF